MRNDAIVPWLENVDPGKVAVVVAHQDDEAIGFSSVLRLCPRALMVHVTDGAPKEERQWKGCSTRRAYAQLRERELIQALAAVGYRGSRFAYEFVDTEAAKHMREIADELSYLFAQMKTSVVFTHAYEGGHPDHDAVALAVHAARKRLEWEMKIIEAPFYRMRGDGIVWQEFVPYPRHDEFVVRLDWHARTLKRRMLDAHVSQHEACAKALPGAEFLREAPPYDFMCPPNAGRLSQNYARAGLDAKSWRALAQAALGQA